MLMMFTQTLSDAKKLGKQVEVVLRSGRSFEGYVMGFKSFGDEGSVVFLNNRLSGENEKSSEIAVSEIAAVSSKG